MFFLYRSKKYTILLEELLMVKIGIIIGSTRDGRVSTQVAD